MRKVLVVIAGCLMLSVAASGCQTWWAETANNYGPAHLDRSLCSINIPTTSPSGWFVEKVNSAAAGSFPSSINGGIQWYYKVPGVIHYPLTPVTLWDSLSGSAGPKPVMGVYPGEIFYMGFSAVPNTGSIELRGTVLTGDMSNNGANATLVYTNSNGCRAVNE